MTDDELRPAGEKAPPPPENPSRNAWPPEAYDRIAEGLRRAARNGTLRVQPGKQPGLIIRDPATGEILFPRPEHYMKA